MSWKVIVVQPGARLHFAVACGLAERRLLDCVVTDFCPSIPIKLLASLRPLSKLGRYTSTMSRSTMICDPLGAIMVRLFQRLLSGTRLRAWAEIWQSARLGKLARKRLISASGRIIAYGFDTSSVELFEYAKRIGAPCVLEQCVAPRRTQKFLLEAQEANFSGKEFDSEMDRFSIRERREEREWELADLIVAPSEYVLDELVSAGVDAGKIRLVPYGFTPDAAAETPTGKEGAAMFDLSGSRLRVLFVGVVDYRKGAHDLVKVSADVEGIDVVMLGSVRLSSGLADQARSVVRLHGPASFETVWLALAQADVFVLPSYLEGSATVIYEALAAGLPVITTRQAGSVVEDGVEGFVIEAGDLDGLETALVSLRDDPDLRTRMAENALKKAKEFTRERYAEKLVGVIRELANERWPVDKISHSASHS